MTSFTFITITIVSSFGLIFCSPAEDELSSLVAQIREADSRGLTHLPGEGLMGPLGLRRAAPDDRLEVRATNLLRSVIGIVQAYSDDDFEDLLAAIRDKIDKISNPDIKVVELKKVIVAKLREVQGEGVRDARGQLAGVLARLDDARLEDRVVKLDTADKRAAALQILTTLNDLDAYRYKAKRVDISLPEVVRRGLEALAGLLSLQGTTPAPPPPGRLVHAAFLPHRDAEAAHPAPTHKQKSQEMGLVEEIIKGQLAPKREPDVKSADPEPHRHKHRVERVTEEADTETAKPHASHKREHKREEHKHHSKHDEAADSEAAEKPRLFAAHKQRVEWSEAVRATASPAPAPASPATRARPGALLGLPDGRAAPLGELLLLSLMSLPSLSKVHLQLVTEKDDDDLRSRGFN